MNDSPTPTLTFTHPFGEREFFEAEARGYLGHAAVRMPTGKMIPVVFYDAVRRRRTPNRQESEKTMAELTVDFDDLETSEVGYNEYTLTGSLFTGIAVERTETGALIGLAGFSLGSKHGPWRSWHVNCLPKKEFYFLDGARNGPLRKWYENGELAYDAYWECDYCIRAKGWNELGKMVKDYKMTSDSRYFPSLKKERAQRQWRVLDIDIETLEFIERPPGWGRDGTELV